VPVDSRRFSRMVFFLAAIMARLLSRVLGALDAPFGPIVAKGGRRAPGPVPRPVDRRARGPPSA